MSEPLFNAEQSAGWNNALAAFETRMAKKLRPAPEQTP